MAFAVINELYKKIQNMELEKKGIFRNRNFTEWEFYRKGILKITNEISHENELNNPPF